MTSNKAPCVHVLRGRCAVATCPNFVAYKPETPMIKADWEVIEALVQAGENESPWGWSADWPQDVDGAKTHDIVIKFRNFVRRNVS